MDKSNKFSYLGSSIITAVITKTAVSPLTRIKVLKQVESYHGKSRYNGLLSSFKTIFKNEGFKGFLKGNLTNISKSIPNYCIKFPLNDFYINRLVKKNNYKSKKDIPYIELLSSGVFTGVFQTITVYPLDLVRTRISQDNKMLKKELGIFSCVKHTVNREGFLSLYKGMVPALLSTPLYIGLQLSLFQNFKKYDYNSLLSGALAGLISQSLMYPGDTVKRQLQINGMNGIKKYNNILDCIKFIYGKNGIKGFYKGLLVNSIKSIPEISIKFTIYEYIKNLF